MKAKKIVCLMGPTASGKTRLAVQLVQKLPFEIISVDSALVYRDMEIGTAKPDQETLRVAPHRLINILDPKESYSAAQFRDDALREIKEIEARGNVPLLVGGTMLYFRALQQGLSDLPSADEAVRSKLSEQADECGWPVMHDYLKSVDPDAALRIHPNDSQRIQRALEVYELTGKSITAWQKESGEPLAEYDFYNLAVAPSNRAVLHERIALRFDQMLEQGFVDEVKKLFERGDLHSGLPSIRSVGYRQVWDYLQGKMSYEEMREKAIIATRQLAKRQLTWLRHWPGVVWFDSEAKDVEARVEEFLRSIV